MLFYQLRQPVAGFGIDVDRPGRHIDNFCAVPDPDHGIAIRIHMENAHGPDGTAFPDGFLQFIFAGGAGENAVLNQYLGKVSGSIGQGDGADTAIVGKQYICTGAFHLHRSPP